MTVKPSPCRPKRRRRLTLFSLLPLSFVLLTGAPRTASAQTPPPDGTETDPVGGTTNKIPSGDHWEITYAYSGQSSYKPKNPDGTVIPWNHIWTNSTFNSQGLSGVDCHYEAIGTVTVTCKWTASANSSIASLQPPPAKLYLTEVCNVTTYGNVPGQADDGASDTAVIQNGDAATFTTAVSSGTHLTQHDGSGGTVTFTHNLSGTLDDTGPETMGGGVLLSYRVSIGSRSLSLSRDGARGETFDADGTGHGDTIYSYQIFSQDILSSLANSDHINWQYFHAILGGGWSTVYDQTSQTYKPNVAYIWSPFESMNDWQNGRWSMMHGAMNQDISSTLPTTWTKDSTPATKGTESYTAIDIIDGATATANYILTIHEPLEEVTHQHADVVMRREIAPGGA